MRIDARGMQTVQKFLEQELRRLSLSYCAEPPVKKRELLGVIRRSHTLRVHKLYCSIAGLLWPRSHRYKLPN